MGPEWVAILALIALFVVGTVLPINMGALAYVAAWLVGMYSLNMDEKDILAGVSGDLVLTLIGVTYLFAIARNNGTVDLIVRTAVRAVGGRVALIPWVMFGVTAVAPVPRAGTVAPPRCRSSSMVSCSSGSTRRDSRSRPPRTTNRIVARTRLTTRLDRNSVISLGGSPLSSITEFVMVP